MKITTSHMNTLALGFAAFAAWYALRQKPNDSTGPSVAEAIFSTAAAQRREVGAASTANADFVGSLTSGTSYAADYTSQYSKRQGTTATSSDTGPVAFDLFFGMP
jgi:hypothetical protein